MTEQPTAYCTVAAANYLPQVLALNESRRRIAPQIPLYLLLVDGERLPAIELPHEITVLTLADLIPDPRERHDLAAIYDVVELATAVKPLLMTRLLERHQRVVYLDPDMWIVSPLSELDALIDAHGVVLTPHFLQPVLPDQTIPGTDQPLPITEVHCLTVGVHNLGFCAAGRNGLPFLSWWWAHLRRECLIYPLFGMFVDQKWTDVGAVLYQAHSLRHYGYNIANHNLHERRFEQHDGRLTVDANADEVRLLHFSGFDPKSPQSISSRLTVPLAGLGLDFPAFEQLAHRYAQVVIGAAEQLGPAPDYGWAADSSGRPLSKRMRRTYRAQLLAGQRPPSPFDPGQLQALRSWKRRALPRAAAGASMDLALGMKYALPDSFSRLKSASPQAFVRVRGALLSGGKVRR